MNICVIQNTLILSPPLHTYPVGFKWGDARRGGDEINLSLLTHYMCIFLNMDSIFLMA